MTDMAAISAAVTSVKTAIDIAKLIKDSKASLQDAEVKLKLAELIEALSDARVEIADLQNLLLDKQATIKTLNDKIEFRQSLVWEDPLYYVVTDSGKEGPYCQKCYDGNSKIARLQKYEKGNWYCTVCESYFTDDDYDGPPSVFFEPEF